MAGLAITGSPPGRSRPGRAAWSVGVGQIVKPAATALSRGPDCFPCGCAEEHALEARHREEYRDDGERDVVRDAGAGTAQRRCRPEPTAATATPNPAATCCTVDDRVLARVMSADSTSA